MPDCDDETGNPLVVDAACGAGLSGAQRARIIWPSFSPSCRLYSPASCSSSIQLGEGVVPHPPAWMPYGLEAGTESSRKPGALGWGRQGLNRMVCFLLFFSFLHLIDWNRGLIGGEGESANQIDSSSRTADCSGGAALLLWAKMN